ncbi:hypothetical protein MFLAVUS_011352 [Mucor flavus]|uniref:EF-hand domain-containing protein n=1 Tax=Mucor flavus TaxID=439312 RepID=A0ABP9ZF99_9FUNG
MPCRIPRSCLVYLEQVLKGEERKAFIWSEVVQSGSSLTEAEITHLKGKFETITSGNGMSAADLKEIYRVAQVKVTDAQIEAQISAVDSTGQGSVDFHDFLSVMNKQCNVDAEEGVTKIFNLLDTDNDGQIDGEDLKRGVALFGNSVTAQDVEEMIASADVDGDGLINYEEFLKVMTPCKVNGHHVF